jgi:iron complex outermembrane receptor protein
MRKHCLAWAGCAMLVGAALAHAQQVPADAGGEPQQLEKVEIVGSHLRRRVDEEGPTPVSIYSREQIEASGADRLADFLAVLPYAIVIGDRLTALEPTFGAAGISLRSLGPNATLVLLNGRRIATYGVAAFGDQPFVDLHSLPLAAVERVEVLRDGASAIYGADAIGGVVNIVLKRDFRGAETLLRAARADRGDAHRSYASASVGAGDLATDRYNAFVSVEALREDALAQTARSLSRSYDQRSRGGADFRVPTSSPPSFRVLGPGGVWQAGAGCPPERRVAPRFGGGEQCLFDAAPYASLLPTVERIGVLAVGSIEPAAGVRLYAEGAHSRSRTTGQLAPTPVRAVLDPETPNNPGSSGMQVLWRPLEAGLRRREAQVKFDRLVGGAQAAWRGWEVDVGAGHNRVRSELSGLNQLRTSAVGAALASGALDPFSDANDAQALAAVKADTLDRYRSSATFVQAKASTELAALAHGPLALATGIERRRERFATALDPLTLSGDNAGSTGEGTTDAAGARSVTAAFVELNWPAARGLELQLAARHDRYSDYGSSTSPKLALRWQPTRAALLRASVGRGFLPPSLLQIHKPRTALGFGVIDPIRCQVPSPPEDCDEGAAYSQQGNPRLQAERSRQHNIGIVLEPLPGLTASVDVWRILHRGKIFLGGEYFLADEAAFPGTVVRAPPSPDDIDAGRPGRIVELRDTYVNLAARDVRGVDVELKGRLAPRPWGTVALGATVSHLERFVERVTPLSPAVEWAGTENPPRPRLRAQFDLGWQRGPWQAGLAVRYVGHWHYGDDFGVLRRVASWTALDLSFGWRGRDDRLMLGVRNAADRAPPFKNADIGYHPAMHDPLGRFVSLAWGHSF